MNPAQAILVFLVRLYRWTLSPLKTAVLGPQARCRFTPSCSAYALEALRRHGAARGSWLALRRILRCHPWGGCGEDCVPPRVSPGQRRNPAHPDAGSGPGPASARPAAATAASLPTPAH